MIEYYLPSLSYNAFRNAAQMFPVWLFAADSISLPINRICYLPLPPDLSLWLFPSSPKKEKNPKQTCISNFFPLLYGLFFFIPTSFHYQKIFGIQHSLVRIKLLKTRRFFGNCITGNLWRDRFTMKGKGKIALQTVKT